MILCIPWRLYWYTLLSVLSHSNFFTSCPLEQAMSSELDTDDSVDGPEIVECNGRRLLIECHAWPSWNEAEQRIQWHCPAAYLIPPQSIDAILCSTPEGAVGVPFFLREAERQKAATGGRALEEPTFDGEILMTRPVKQAAIAFMQEYVSIGMQPRENKETDEDLFVTRNASLVNGFLVFSKDSTTGHTTEEDDTDMNGTTSQSEKRMQNTSMPQANFAPVDVFAFQRCVTVVNRGERYPLQIARIAESVEKRVFSMLFVRPCDGGYIPGAVQWQLCSGSEVVTVFSSPTLPHLCAECDHFIPLRSIFDRENKDSYPSCVFTRKYQSGLLSDRGPNSLADALASLDKKLQKHRIVLVTTEPHPWSLDMLNCFNRYFSGRNSAPSIVFACQSAKKLIHFSETNFTWINDYWQEKVENKGHLLSVSERNESVDVILDQVSLKSRVATILDGQESSPILFLATNSSLMKGSMAHFIKCECGRRNVDIPIVSDDSLFGLGTTERHSGSNIRTSRATMSCRTMVYSLPAETAAELSFENQDIAKQSGYPCYEHFEARPMKLKRIYNYGHGSDMFNCSTVAGALST
eukprot:gb/GECG01000159.1/.p1 GENE.gb/GECG01000159.1/~~gb/GECG01000159.1/.p1  ORF type:complete len:580 (+),score=51.24 gb/GECG01000159.1/:1-1740(+)